jgi:hypothetical protein
VDDPLQNRLESLAEAKMPPEAERRIRTRLADARRRPEPSAFRRLVWRGSLAQLMLLVVLLIAAAWVVRTQVLPVVVSAWEEYCAPDRPGTGRP